MIATIIVGAVLGLLLIASVWYQFVSDEIGNSRVPTWMQSPLALGLLPRWTFFAPRPGVHDFHLLVREELAEGSYTVWREVEIAPPRRRRHLFVNPGKRQRKFVGDVTLNLLKLSHGWDHEQARELTMLSLPYIVFLEEARRQHPPRWGGRLQFALATRGGLGTEDTIAVAFLSELHAVTPVDSTISDTAGAAGPAEATPGLATLRHVAT